MTERAKTTDELLADEVIELSDEMLEGIVGGLSSADLSLLYARMTETERNRYNYLRLQAEKPEPNPKLKAARTQAFTDYKNQMSAKYL